MLTVLLAKMEETIYAFHAPKVVVTPHPLVHKMHPTIAVSLNLMAVTLDHTNEKYNAELLFVFMA